MTDLVTANTDLTSLTVEQVNWLIGEAGETMEVDGVRFLELNASAEYQYEVTYESVGAQSYVVNHAFIDIDLQGDPRLMIQDMVEDDDLFAD